MGEKTIESSSPIRTISSLRFFNKLFFRSSDNRGSIKIPLSFNRLRASAGFTLIELIVVISLIAILSTTLIVIINPKFQIQRANDSKRKTDIKQIQAALELYRADNGSYPVPGGDYQSDTSSSSCSGNGGIIHGSTVYMSNIPCDPLKTDEYAYSLSGSGYILVACLENSKDSDITTPNCSSGNRVKHPYRYQVTNP